jgi:aminopeptidase N
MSRPVRSASTPKTVRLAEYAPPAFLVDAVDLVIDLDEDGTTVRSRLTIRRNGPGPLRLDGEGLALVACALDGETLGPNRYQLDETGLTLPDLPDLCTLDIETRIHPESNTALSGLYKSGGNFCTQCEAEGFRRITFFPDRPDVMARYTTTIVADRQRYPVLLSNGDKVDGGEVADGRHWAQWVDPHPKPSYLFALVAGDLVALHDRFVTKSGRDVALAIWVRHHDLPKCRHAMDSLKASMAWDEQVFGLEYDLDTFNIVAVADFNMGAMENKGLNVFNARYVLAAPATATDADYQGIERVVAHEYFHNWTGNRVTCRDWFQLSLKEGLTVFRDQQFMCDRHGLGVKRIEDVRVLRGIQFPEDDGPLAHPVQPDSYIEINNFYTATVYNKGAELVRMIQTLIGRDAFRRGMDLYIGRHDNQAVTIEDFLAAMQDASGVDLTGFRLWYQQAGTPEIDVEEAYDKETASFRLSITQHTRPTPGQPVKAPLPIPIALGLLGPDGAEQSWRLPGEPTAIPGTRVVTVTEQRQTIFCEDVHERPVPSLFRGFSAPVKLRFTAVERLKFLARYETDLFARWDAGQRYALQLLSGLVGDIQAGTAPVLDPDLIEIVRSALHHDDPAFAAEAMTLPGEQRIADEMPLVDVAAIHAARRFVRAGIGAALAPDLLATYQALDADGPYRVNPADMGRRALRNLCLSLLAAADTDDAVALAKAQFDAGNNMTDVLAALQVLNDCDRPERTAALAEFYQRWSGDDLVIDKWFTIQATASLAGAIDRVEALSHHPDFDLRNPNRVRALIGAFAQGNPLHFHDANGRGYAFLVDKILSVDRLNAQIAARLVQALGPWRRHEPGRRALMRTALERILAAPELSRNTFEMASKSLG